MSVVYDSIGDKYNRTRRADPYLLERLFYLLGSQPGQLYLDIGCGTGNYTVELAAKGLRFVGVDPSEKMLKEAREKSPAVEWKTGSAENIPVSRNTFAGAVATLTLHHWTNLEKGFSELHRVMQPGSRLVIFSSLPEQMEGYWLNHYFPKMISRSIGQMPGMKKILSAAESAGFTLTGTEKYFVRPDLTDHFLYAGKDRPELYFDENVRAGISSFAALANREEVDTGLKNLKRDTTTGRFLEIKKQYVNDLGDYIFIQFGK